MLKFKTTKGLTRDGYPLPEKCSPCIQIYKYDKIIINL